MSEQENNQFDELPQAEVGFDNDPGIPNLETAPEPVTVPVEAPVETKEPDSIDLPPFEPNIRSCPTVTKSHEIYREVTGKKNNDPVATLVPKRPTSFTKNNPRWAGVGGSKENQSYAATWFYGVAKTSISSPCSLSQTENFNKTPIFVDELDSPENEWVQGVQHENAEIKLGRARVASLTVGSKLTGGSARNAISARLGIGLDSRVPLPHSGVTIDLRSRSEGDLIDLEIKLSKSLERGGPATVGAIFQSSGVVRERILWDYIKESITRANVAGYADGAVDLGDVILITDFWIALWGVTTTMHPNGHMVDLPCSSGVDHCKHVERRNLNLDKIMWLNQRKLSKQQRMMLMKNNHNLTTDELEQYLNSYVSPFKGQVKLDDDFVLNLKVPTINKYLAAGETTLAELTAAAQELFGSEMRETEELTTYVNAQTKITAIREYAAWIESITVSGAVIENSADLRDALINISASQEYCDTALKGIQSFIEKCTLAVIAIPNFACPVCEAPFSTDEHSEHPELVPLDMVKHFFTLKDLKLARRSALLEQS